MSAGLLSIMLRTKSNLLYNHIAWIIIPSEHCTIRDIDEAAGVVVLSFNMFNKDYTKSITDIEVWLGLVPLSIECPFPE